MVFYIWRKPYPSEHGMKASISYSLTDNSLQRISLSGLPHRTLCLQALGRTVITGGRDCTVRVWNITTGDCEWVFMGHRASVTSVCLDEISVYSSSGDATTRIWSRHTGECLHILASPGHHFKLGVSTNYLLFTRYTADGLDLAVRIWGSKTGELLHEVECNYRALHHDDRKIVLCKSMRLDDVDEEEGKIGSSSGSNLPTFTWAKIIETGSGFPIKDIAIGNRQIHHSTVQGRFYIRVAPAKCGDGWSLKVGHFEVDDDDEYVEGQKSSPSASPRGCQ